MFQANRKRCKKSV